MRYKFTSILLTYSLCIIIFTVRLFIHIVYLFIIISLYHIITNIILLVFFVFSKYTINRGLLIYYLYVICSTYISNNHKRNYSSKILVSIFALGAFCKIEISDKSLSNLNSLKIKNYRF